MPKGKKFGGRDFPKGTSGNPNGRPSAPKELRDALRDQRLEFVVEAQKLFKLTGPEVEAIACDPKAPWLQATIARVMAITFNKGCYQRFEFLVNNAMAGLPKHIELTDADGEPLRPLAEIPTEKLLEFFETLASKK